MRTLSIKAIAARNCEKDPGINASLKFFVTSGITGDLGKCRQELLMNENDKSTSFLRSKESCMYLKLQIDPKGRSMDAIVQEFKNLEFYKFGRFYAELVRNTDKSDPLASFSVSGR